MEIRFIPGDGQTWASLPLRLIEIQLIDFGDFVKQGPAIQQAKQAERVCRIVAEHAEACTLTLNLVHEGEPRLYSFALYIVRQYFVVVCERCQTWANQLMITSVSFEEVKSKLKSNIQEVQEILQEHWPATTLLPDAASELAKVWMGMNISLIVFTSVAPLWDRKTGLFDFMQGFKYGPRWCQSSKKFRPTAAVFDYTDCVVATTFAHWKGHRGFQEWEKRVRDAVVPMPMQHLFKCAREALAPIREQKECWQVVFEEAKRATEQAFGQGTTAFQLCTKHEWLGLDGHILKCLDQCATCRILFWPVVPVKDGASEPQKPWRKLGDG